MAPAKAAAAARRGRGGGDLPVVVGALTGGLLASSCCVIQLVLNSLSVGCAGLSVFKPYRGVLRAATAALLALLLARGGLTRRTLGTLLCSLLLAGSEDALAIVNRHGSMRAALRRAGQLALLRWGKGGGGEAAAPPAQPAAVRWRLEVDGMRCQACAARVRSAAAALPGVRNATVELASGALEVWADCGPAEGASGGGGGGGAAGASSSSGGGGGGGGPLTGEGLAAAVAALGSSYRVRVAGSECFAADTRPAACSGPCGGGAGKATGVAAASAQSQQGQERQRQQQQEEKCQEQQCQATVGVPSADARQVEL